MRVCFPIFPRGQAAVPGVLDHLQHLGGTKRFDDVENVPGRQLERRLGAGEAPAQEGEALIRLSTIPP